MSKSLLVADNSITIQKSVGITFAQEDFKITYVDNGEDAVSKAKEIKPDVILADVEMPKRSGYDVCQALKSDPDTKTVPVLLLAGTHEPFDEARGKQAGADGYVIKPFESQALIDRVNSLLSGEGAPAQPEAAVPPPVAEPPAAQPPAAQPNDAPAPSQAPPQAAVPAPPTPDLATPPSPPAPASPNQEPSPAATIAGQSQGAPQPPADSPMLDLGAPEEEPAPAAQPPTPKPTPDDASFDFSFDGTEATQTPTSEEPTGPITPPPSEAAPTPTSETDSTAEADIWDFGGETEVASTSEPATPATTPEIESPAEMANWSEPSPSETTTPPTTPEANEFGFDLSPEPASEEPTGPTIEPGMGDSIAFETPREEASSTETPPMADMDFAAPEEADDMSFAEAPALEETPAPVEPAAPEEFEAPTGIEMTPEPSLAEPTSDVQGSSQDALPGNLTPEQTEEIVRKVFKDVIERIAWEVVPDLAETIIREELERLTKES